MARGEEKFDSNPFGKLGETSRHSFLLQRIRDVGASFFTTLVNISLIVIIYL